MIRTLSSPTTTRWSSRSRRSLSRRGRRSRWLSQCEPGADYKCDCEAHNLNSVLARGVCYSLRMRALLILLTFTALAFTQQMPLIVNLPDSAWLRSTSPEGTGDIVFLPANAKTGGIELLARYEPGHVFKPHWHDSNERLILFEGRLSLGKGIFLEPGGFAFLPAREVQHMECVSTTRCTFYVSWDGNSKSHLAPAAGN